MRPIDADALKEKFADILDSTYTDDYAKGYVNGLRAALNMPTLTPSNEWVSAKERLPKPFECVIVCYENRSVQLAWIYTNGKWLFEERYGSVTHWMPLPAPPDRHPGRKSMKIKDLEIKDLTSDELVHWVRSLCCVLPVDDSEIKIRGKLQIYIPETKCPTEGE